MVAYGDFHTTEVVDDQLTATIAIAIKMSGKPLVVGSNDGLPSYSYARSEFSTEAQGEIRNLSARFFDGHI
jgi:hypothetical protein